MTAPKRCYWDGNPCDCSGECQRDPFGMEPDPLEDTEAAEYRNRSQHAVDDGVSYE